MPARDQRNQMRIWAKPLVDHRRSELMMTLRQFLAGIEAIPTASSWYLADLGEARGKQELFSRQSPKKLKVLREHALIESAVSSNRIEGVVADQARIATIVFGKADLHDRNEEEIRGYDPERMPAMGGGRSPSGGWKTI